MLSFSNQNQIYKLGADELLPLICAAAALRKEEHLKLLIERAKFNSIGEKALYESLLQNYLFTGYPSAMISLKILKENYPKQNNSDYESWDLTKYRQRGTKNCKKVYGRKFNKLISNVKSFSPELADWLLLEGYGKVMGRKGLSLKQRELNNVAVLSVLEFEDQLYSHINGAFRTETSMEEVKKVIKNLKIIGANESSRFGLNVLRKYVNQKGID
jgi:4-carboxymuconolactone decarboxylase